MTSTGIDQQKYASKLADTNVLIIGGSSGIGFGVAELALEHGARVTISSSSAQRIAQAVGKLKEAYPSKANNIRGFRCDLGDLTTMEVNLVNLLNYVKEEVGSINHVVHTAGDSLARSGLQDTNIEDILKYGRVALLYTSVKVSTDVNSGQAMPRKGMTLTTAYLGGVVAMTKNLALDLAPIRVNVVMPGAVDTELWAGVTDDAKAAMFRSWEDQILTGRVGRVVDVVEAYHYLWRDEYATGTVVQSDGGHSLVNIG